MQLGVTLVVAWVAGHALSRLRVPGGLLVGAMVGSAVTTLAWGRALTLPFPLLAGAFVVIGLSTGVLVTRERLRALAPLVAPALVSAIALILAGGLIALLLHALGIAPPAVILGTSPGGLSVLVAASIEHGEGAAEVALFHTVRLVMVIALIPLILRFFATSDD